MVQENLRGKTKPAGEKDKFRFTGTNFASNKGQTNLKTGNGKEFDNDELLKMLGFKEKDGVMSVAATSNEVVKEDNGKVTKRTADGRTLTGENKEEAEIGD